MDRLMRFSKVTYRLVTNGVSHQAQMNNSLDVNPYHPEEIILNCDFYAHILSLIELLLYAYHGYLGGKEQIMDLVCILYALFGR